MKKWLLYYMLTLVLLLTVRIGVEAQINEVAGKVIDDFDEPIPGVNIIVSGTSHGIISDMDGKFRLSIPEGKDTLLFSMVGFDKRTVIVDGRDFIVVNLTSSVIGLEEFVVVGYGSMRKSDITGAVSVISADDMAKGTDMSVERAIQGKASGVYVSSGSGQPGSNSSVKIRGLGSINMNSEPLYIVDGVEVSHHNISSISPGNIVSVSVLKDASSAAIYGTRGANGVILIETKRGERGTKSPIVSINSYVGMAEVPSIWEVMDAEQYTGFMEAVYDEYSQNLASPLDANNKYHHIYADSARLANNNLGTDTDFYDHLIRRALQQSHNLSIAGGAENVNYNVGLDFTEEEGTLKNTAFQRYGFYINSDLDLNDRLTIGESIKLLYSGRNDMRSGGGYHNGGPLWAAAIASPYMPMYDESAEGGFGGPTTYLTGDNERTNPVAEQSLYWNQRDNYWLYSNIYAEYRFTDHLSFRSNFSYNLGFNHYEQFVEAYSLGNVKQRDNPTNDRDVERNVSGKNWEFNHLLSYNNVFGGLSLSGILGFERNYSYSDYIGLVGETFPSEDVRTFPNAETSSIKGESISERTLESYFGRINLNYENKYFINASIRVDGSSNIGPVSEGWLPERLGAFPSFSAGWNLKDDFLSQIDFISTFKIRGGWGVTGNQNIQPYAFMGLLTPQNFFRYTFGANQRPVFGVANLWNQPNPGIKWEEARMTNAGVDVNLFNNKLQLVAEYYVKNQDDMLIQKPTSTHLGKDFGERGGTWPAQPWVNLGRVQNSGYEFNFSWKQKLQQLNYSIGGNISTVNNRVIELGQGVDPIYTDHTITKEGHQIGSFFGYIWSGVFQDEEEVDNWAFQTANTRPGDFKFLDLNGDGQVDANDRTIIGKPLPDFIYGFSGDLSYGLFDLLLVFQGIYGYDVFNGSYRTIGLGTDQDGRDNNRLVSVYENAWREDNKVTRQSRIAKEDESGNSRISSYFVEDASFLRFKTLQVGMQLPERLLNALQIKECRLYASIDNLHVFTNYQGLDPEFGGKDPKEQGLDYFTYPKSRTTILGVQIKF